MASVYPKRGVLVLAYTDPHSGVRIQKSLGLKDTRSGRAEAKRIREDVESALRYDPTSFMRAQTEAARLTPRLSNYIATLMQTEHYRNRAENTRKLIELSGRKLIDSIGDLPLGAYTTQRLLDFKRESLECGETNTAIWLRCLSAVFNCAVRDGLILSSPITRDVKIRQSVGRPVVMLKDEVRAFMDKALEMYGPEFQRQCRFLSLTGFRSGESCSLRRSQLDFERMFIEHQNEKGDRLEPFPIYGGLLDLLMPAQTLEPGAFVFHFRSIHTLSHYFAAVRTKLEMNERYTIHTLKKNFVTALIEGKVYAPYVKRLANHIDMKTTENFYAWFNIDEMRDELERVNSLGLI